MGILKSIMKIVNTEIREYCLMPLTLITTQILLLLIYKGCNYL